MFWFLLGIFITLWVYLGYSLYMTSKQYPTYRYKYTPITAFLATPYQLIKAVVDAKKELKRVKLENAPKQEVRQVIEIMIIGIIIAVLFYLPPLLLVVIT